MMVLLGVRFLAEIGMLASLAWGGWSLGGSNTTVSLLLAVLAPALGAAVWGLWVAPRAARRLVEPYRLAVELLLFAVAFLLVLRAQPAPPAALFGLAVTLAFLVSLPARRAQP